MKNGIKRYCIKASTGMNIELLFEEKKRKTISFKAVSSNSIQVFYPEGGNAKVVLSILEQHRDEIEKALNLYRKTEEKVARYRPNEAGSQDLWINWAQQEITGCALFWCGRMQLKPTYIKIKNMKSRWGSCTVNNGINLNIRLAYAPKDVMAYVIIHELCHMKHKHHQKSFWDEIEKYDQKYKQHRKWLRENGGVLMNIPLGWQKVEASPILDEKEKPMLS